MYYYYYYYYYYYCGIRVTGDSYFRFLVTFVITKASVYEKQCCKTFKIQYYQFLIYI